jgi:hypothetical protein
LRIVPSPIFNMAAGEWPESVAQPAHVIVSIRHFTLTLTLLYIPNLCPSLTDICMLRKQFLQRRRAHARTHTQCSPVVLYFGIWSLCRSQSVKRCTWVWWSGFLEELRTKNGVRKTEKVEEREWDWGIPQSPKYFFILCPSGSNRGYLWPASLGGSVASKDPAFPWWHYSQAVWKTDFVLLTIQNDMGLFVQFWHQLGGAEYSPLCEQHAEHTATEEPP